MQTFKLLSDIEASAERILVMLENETPESFLGASSMAVRDAVARRFTVRFNHLTLFANGNN